MAYPDNVLITTTTASGLLEVAFSVEVSRISLNQVGQLRFFLLLDGMQVPNKNYFFGYFGGNTNQTFSGTWLTPVAAGAHDVQMLIQLFADGIAWSVEPRRVLIVKEVVP